MENTIYGLFKEKVQQQPEATAIIENTRPVSPLRMKRVRSWAAAGSVTRARCPRPITPPAQTDIS